MQQRPYRCLLFVPGDKPEMLAKATRFGADAYVLDLEDAVAEDNKHGARDIVRDAIPRFAEQGVGSFVRINAVDTPHWLGDLQSIAVPGLTGIILPKAASVGEVTAISIVLDTLEDAAGIARGTIDIQLLLETAPGIQNAYELMHASPRVRSAFGGAAPDADVNRSLGFRWTKEGRETLYVRSRILLAARAAGLPYPVTGTWTDLEDLEGLRTYAIEGRNLGYSGMYAIHPGQVAVINEVFTPSAAEVERARGIIAAMEQAASEGLGAVRFEGTMIDIAMVAGAHEVLSFAEQVGVPV
ncbi:MAG TPA: CoA ester lyase [Gaiellaceae bacterium]|nr:CoA ester lyase [Gaiellaceae bacterium]